MRVLFVHPDLGIGGAERLIVDAALAAKSSGHDVTILTNQYDPSHCFEETKDMNIIVKCSSMPRNLFGRLHAFFAYLKITLASLWLVLFSGLKFDVVVCDQVSLPVAVFKWKHVKTVFYCHFPDQLLCVNRSSLKQLYRMPIDWFEELTTGMADVILVNSLFTRDIFRRTFTKLASNELQVLNPSLNTEFFDSITNENGADEAEVIEPHKKSLVQENKQQMAKIRGKKYVFLSINRYERKKDLKLALEAMVSLRESLLVQGKADVWHKCHLVMAGGYDWRVRENVNYYDELKQLAEDTSFNLSEHVTFLRSISDQQKAKLMRSSFCLLYTPTNEHFGIVPVEAMYCGNPIIATNTGGPLETVVDSETGYLVEPKAVEFALKMEKLILEPKLQTNMGSAGRARVIKYFSFLSFRNKLDAILKSLLQSSDNNNKAE